MKRAGRGPAGRYVGEEKRVEHSPEYVALRAEGSVSCILFFARASMLHDPCKSELGVLRSLRQTGSEVVQAFGEPRIVHSQAVHAKGDQPLREEFGEGGSHGFQMGASGDELKVGVNGETGGGKNPFAADSLQTR